MDIEICFREVSNILRSASSTYSPGRIPEIENCPAEFVAVFAFTMPAASRSVIFAPAMEAPEESSTCPVTEFVSRLCNRPCIPKHEAKQIRVRERQITGGPKIRFISHPRS